MRRPNGNGSITKLKGNRRKPYKVTVTTGWCSETGRQLRKLIGYYSSSQAANKALSDYLINPFDLNLSDLTFTDIYNKWSEIKYTKVGASAITGYKAAYLAFEKLYNIKFRDLKTVHLQNILDKSEKGYATRKRMKILLNQMYDYAIQNDIVSKDYSQYVEIGKHDKTSARQPFSIEEINLLWKHLEDIEFIDTILIMIYSSFRIGELLELESKNINLENMTMTGGIKTEAGKNRLIPIHHKILPLIKARYNPDNEYFIMNSKGKQMTYDNYYKEKFLPIMEQLNMKHRPHDCRHTFATLMSNANANKTAIKKMVGHESYATTEKIYTHKDIEELRKNIELINI